MTDRIQHLTVILDQDYRTDDVEDIITAIKMIKGISAVERGAVVEYEDHMARERARLEFKRLLLQVLK
jgi:tRNA uridine 5-carbamoylmethylation protein Kti12